MVHGLTIFRKRSFKIVILKGIKVFNVLNASEKTLKFRALGIFLPNFGIWSPFFALYTMSFLLYAMTTLGLKWTELCRCMAYLKPMEVFDVFTHVLLYLTKCPNASSQVDVMPAYESNQSYFNNTWTRVILLLLQIAFKCHSSVATGTISVEKKAHHIYSLKMKIYHFSSMTCQNRGPVVCH